jgi:tetratricopeptide (TPR) repeat protein
MVSKKYDVQMDSLFLKGCEIVRLGDLSGGLAIFYSLEKDYPNNAHLKFLIASIDYDLGNYTLVKERLEESIKLDGLKKQVNHLLGNAYREMGLFELALDAYKKEIILNPEYPDVLNDMGITLYNLHRLDDALQSYEKAHQLDKGFADPLHNKAIIFIQQRKFIEAEYSLQLAIELKPKNFAAISTLANLKKYLCDFESGWDLYQHRFEFELLSEKKYFTKPVWADKQARDKRIYLYGEQGIGDQILFGTMFREAFETQNNFIVSVDERLLPIFNRSFFKYKNVSFISKSDEVKESLFDIQLAIGDLGKFFRKSKGDFKAIAPCYLLSNEVKRNALRDQFVIGKNITCGVAWKSASNSIGLDKSLNLRELEPILHLRGISFVDLQYGDTLEEREALKRECGVNINKVKDIDNFNDIDGLASIIDGCDFIVTTSNVTAHIAGALGKKVFLMVPYSKGRCWYWHDGLKQSIWYPSIEIFSQSDAGDWSVPINEIKEKILEEISHE